MLVQWFAIQKSIANNYLEDVLFTLTGSVGDLAVVKDDTITTSTTVRLGPADALGELGVVVGKEELQRVNIENITISPGRINTYNVVVLDTVGLAPGAHDEWVVDGKDGNDIDTLGLEFRELLDVLGDVSGRTDRGEGT